MRKPWWTQKVLPAEANRPATYQHACCMVGMGEDPECDHVWEVISEVWLGEERQRKVWIYTDYCRACHACRLRKISQTPEKALWDEDMARETFVETRKEQVEK